MDFDTMALVPVVESEVFRILFALLSKKAMAKAQHIEKRQVNMATNIENDFLINTWSNQAVVISIHAISIKISAYDGILYIQFKKGNILLFKTYQKVTATK